MAACYSWILENLNCLKTKSSTPWLFGHCVDYFIWSEQGRKGNSCCLSHSVVSLSIRLLFSVLLLFSPTPYPQAGLINTQVILLWGVESWWCQWLVTLCIYCNICFYPLIDTSRGSVMGYWRFIFVLNQQNIQFDCKATDVCNLKVTYSLFTTEAVRLVFVMSCDVMSNSKHHNCLAYVLMTMICIFLHLVYKAVSNWTCINTSQRWFM